MRLISNKADVAGGVFLAAIVLGGAALALAGHEGGLWILLVTAGVGHGWALVHLAVRRWGGRSKRVALLASVGVVALLLAPLVGPSLGVGWIVYPSLGSGSPYSGFFFGLAMGAGQVAFGVLTGFDPRAGE